MVRNSPQHPSSGPSQPTQTQTQVKYVSINANSLNGIILMSFLLLGTVSCKSTERTSGERADNPAADSVEAAATSGQAGDYEQSDIERMEDIYWARVDSARMTFSQADVDFMIGMISHHAQALIMSRLAPENGASQQVRTLAARIINAQKDEIETMQEWLRLRGQPVPEVHIDGLNLTIHIEGYKKGHGDHTNMPGMLSQEQLVELSEARGTDFDRLFLRYMIDHHKGAVVMVRKLVNTDGAAQEEDAFRLASDIQVDQITEIERMKIMLDNLPDPGKMP